MKKVVGMAAMPDREHSLKLSIRSLYDQADVINLALNGFNIVPDFLLDLPKVNPILTSNDNGDANKYIKIDEYDNVYYFSCDDDLIYPIDYIDTYIRNIDKYKGLITIHGSILPGHKMSSYFEDRTLLSHYNNKLESDTFIDVPGTGVSGFNTSNLKLKYNDFVNANMADIFVGIACKQQGINCIAISHQDNWVQNADCNINNTLYKKHRHNDSIQTGHLNKINWGKSNMKNDKCVNSKEYWEDRYITGRNSGDGSYGKLAEFKAEIINDVISKNNIKHAIELGCGDGNQLQKFKVSKYTGYDVSKTVIDMCIDKYKEDKSKSFTNDLSDLNKADLTLSLDVLYHLVEDLVYIEYLKNLFELSNDVVIVYTFNKTAKNVKFNGHIRYRSDIEVVDFAESVGFDLHSIVKNRYPYNSETKTGSYADFLIFKKNK